MKKNILIVEDEIRIREIVKDFFEMKDFKVYEAEDGKTAVEIFENNEIDLVILDIMLPEVDGWSVCGRLRKKSSVPIIIVTARSEEDDKLLGYELGADDYMTKPFSPKVLVAKSEMLLKRVEGSIGKKNSTINICGIEIDKLSFVVKIEDNQIFLSPKEFELLLYLIENKGIVLSRENILNNVWGYDYFGDLRTVDTHVKKLRNKLEDKSKYIHTVIKAGYKFEVNI